tara:strand:- start:535 stop:858 length:324 start_codon:yes stop_codon:yes gene_type:complete
MHPATHLKPLTVLVALLLLASACGSETVFKEEVANIIHGRCVAGLEQQTTSVSALEEAGLTVADACTCAVDLVAENYEVIDLTLMGDETMDIVFTNAGRTCSERLTG